MTTTLVIAAVVIGFVACGVTIVALIEQRDTAVTNWADEIFANAALKHRLATATADFDALLARHAELAGEHAECPVPVSPVLAQGGIVTRTDLVIVGEHGEKALDLPVADVEIPVHTDIVDDDWLELLVTRPADGPTS